VKPVLKLVVIASAGAILARKGSSSQWQPVLNLRTPEFSGSERNVNNGY